MALKEKINEDIKTAMKAKDSERLSVLRMMLSEIKYAQAQTNVHAEIADADVEKIVSTYSKKLEKGLADYPPGPQRDKIVNEIKIVGEYLPKKLGEAETNRAIDKVIAGTADRNFGSLMKLVMAELGSGADGKLVSQLLKTKIS